MGDVRHRQRQVAEPHIDPGHLLVGQLQQIFQQPKFVQNFERGGMNRVPAKIPQEVGVLLQDKHINAGASQPQSQHHSGRTASRDAAVHRHVESLSVRRCLSAVIEMPDAGSLFLSLVPGCADWCSNSERATVFRAIAPFPHLGAVLASWTT